VSAFGLQPVPPDAIVDGAIIDAGAVADAIRRVFDENKAFKAKEVCASLSGNAVIVKKITLPVMTASELNDSIAWEAEQYIPFDIQDVFLDAEIVGTPSGSGQMDVVLVAAKKDLITEYTSVIIEAGLEPVVCDVDSFALENMFAVNYEMPQGKTIALVNVGAAKTNINILARGASVFTRDLSIGGNAVSEELQNELDVPYEDAERLKVAFVEGEGIAEDGQKAIQAVCDNIAGEVLRSIDFYSATSSDAAPSAVYLCGGSAKLQPLVRAIEEQVGATVEVVNPFRNIALDVADRGYIEKFSAAAGIAVGLALRYPGDR